MPRVFRASTMFLVMLPAIAFMLSGPVAIVCAQPLTDARARTAVYRLDADAMYLNSCFDPCDCVTQFASPLQGTMQLTLTSIAPSGERVYKVDDVNFRIDINGADLLVRGSGTYSWYPSLGMLTVLAHRMQLNLSIDAGPIQRFDSELIAGATDGTFPPIRIVVDKNNQVCIDEVLTINASPVPPAEIVPYCLTADSQAVRGCFAPCMCPLQLQGALAGSFALVKLPTPAPVLTPRPTLTEYAVIRARFSVLSPGTLTAERITGSGFYDVQQPSLIEGLERVQLALVRDAQPERVWRFVNSIFAPAPQPPAAVQWDLSLNNLYCYDEALYVRAVRCRPRFVNEGALEQEKGPSATESGADAPLPADAAR